MLVLTFHLAVHAQAAMYIIMKVLFMLIAGNTSDMALTVAQAVLGQHLLQVSATLLQDPPQSSTSYALHVGRLSLCSQKVA